jgi:hypothetical protein
VARLAGIRRRIEEGRRALQRELFHAVGALKREVEADRASFREAHAEMARTSQNNRVMFVTDLSHQVAGLLHSVADDLKGARQAWRG